MWAASFLAAGSGSINSTLRVAQGRDVPNFMVTGPDGRRYKVSGPEGATQEQALQQAQQFAQQNPGGRANPAPIQVQGPDGSTVEFPSGTGRDVMEAAMRGYAAEQPPASAWNPSTPQGTIRLQKIEQALRAADAAGNSDDARRLAQAYVQERNSQGSHQVTRRAQLPDGTILEFPGETPDAVMDRAVRSHLAEARKPDFGNVQSAASTVPADAGTIGRGIKLGARATMEGVAAIPDFFAGPVRYGVEKATGIPQTTYGDMASSLADRMGLPKPQTSGERVMSDVGRAISGTAATIGMGAAMPAGSSLGALLTAQKPTQVLSAATGSASGGIARENGASPGSQLLASLAGGMAPGSALSGGEGIAQWLLRGGEKGRQRVSNTIADFASVGATPSVGQATGNWRTQGIESLLSGGPTSGGVMSRFAERQADQIGAGLGRRADALSSNASAERAGRAVERGAEVFAGNTKATKRALYWLADKQIPDATPVAMPNTWQKVIDLTTPNPGAAATTGAMVNGTIAKLRTTLAQDLAAGGGRISYDALKRIRSDIGEAISDYSLSPDTPTREYKALYAALSRDMEEAAQSQGPAAVEAARRANNYTRAAADRLETIDRVIQKNGGPEKVYGAVMSGTQDGGTTLRAVMQSLPKEGQKAVTAAVIKRMGMATPGNQSAVGDTFSSATFLTNWNKISPEAKRALFDRYGPFFSANMDRIARVAENIKNGSKVYANPSGSANKLAGYGYWTGVAGSAAATPFTGVGPLASLLAGGLGANVAAKVLTNPRVVAWLATNADKPIGAALGSLEALAQQDPDANELYRSLTQGGQRNSRATPSGQSLQPQPQ